MPFFSASRTFLIGFLSLSLLSSCGRQSPPVPFGEDFTLPPIASHSRVAVTPSSGPQLIFLNFDGGYIAHTEYYAVDEAQQGAFLTPFAGGMPAWPMYWDIFRDVAGF